MGDPIREFGISDRAEHHGPAGSGGTPARQVAGGAGRRWPARALRRTRPAAAAVQV